MIEQDGKLSDTDLWRMYRQPTSVDALIPIAIVLCTLREENLDGKGDERALRFSRGIADELKDRGSLDGGVHLYFGGELIPIDSGFYFERLEAYGAVDTRSPKHEDMEKFVRETYADNMVVPLSRLIVLHNEGHIPLPAALKARHGALVGTGAPWVAPSSRAEITRKPATKAERALEFFSQFDLTAEYEIEGRMQRIDAENACLFARERGLEVGRDNAHAALKPLITPQRGRPRKSPKTTTS